MKLKFKKDKIYQIKFYDHCTGEDEMVCEIVGWFTHSTRHYVFFDWWKTKAGSGCTDTEKSNRESVSILKSTIVDYAEINSWKENKLKQKNRIRIAYPYPYNNHLIYYLFLVV